VRRHWHAFHNSWATYISSDLNRRLPEGYFAEGNVQFSIEIDVASFEESARTTANGPPSQPTSDWTPTPPLLTVPIALATDTVEVLLFHDEGGPTLAGAVELVSPANKDRPAHRDAFLSKCVTYIQQGVGLVVVDVVTERKANLHAELLARLATTDTVSATAGLHAAAYRAVEREGQQNLDVWHEALAVRSPLPTMPLWLRGGLCFPIELEATYERTCEEQRVPLHGA